MFAMFMVLVFLFLLVWTILAVMDLQISIILKLCLIPVAIEGVLFLLGFVYGFMATLMGA